MDVIWMILALLVPGAIVVGFRRHRHFRLVVGGIALTLGAVWTWAAVAIETDYRDADGFVDCWPSCSAFQEVIGFVYLAVPVALLVVLLAAVVVSLPWRRRKGDRAAGAG